MNKLLGAIVFLLFVGGCYFFPHNNDIVTRQFSPEKLRTDFTLFRAVLEKSHPGIYTYTSKEEMDQCFDSIYNSLNASTDLRAFHHSLSFLIDKIGCSHTNLYLSKDYYDTIFKRSNFFPVPIVYVDGGLYVNSDMFSIPLGAHIIGINGNRAEDIMNRITDYNVPDGVNKDYNLSQAAVDFAYDYFLAYGPSAGFDIEYAEAASPKKETIHLVATTLEKQQAEYNYNAYYYYPDEVGYDFEIIDSLQTAVLTLRSFSYSTATTFAAYKNFLFNSFSLLKNQDDITNLVIDCRNNTGGEYENIFLLYRFLSRDPFKEVDSATICFDKLPYPQYLDPDYAVVEKPALDSMINHEFCRLPNGTNVLLDDDNTLRRPLPMAFIGNVYVITNTNVLSAASNFVAMMKDSKRGVIVGETTGGGYNEHNGFTRVLYKLPNTGLMLEYSAVRVRHYLQHRQMNKYGVQPDFIVTPTLTDIINNQDPQMSFTLNQLIAGGQ